MGGLSIARGIIGGLAGAAGDPQTQQQMATANQQEQVRQQNLQRAKIAPFALNVKNLHQQLETVQPGSQQANDITDQIQHNVHSMREVLHPDWKPGPSEWLQTHLTDRMHITNAASRGQERNAKEQEAQQQEKQIAQSQTAVPTDDFAKWSAEYQRAVGQRPTPEDTKAFLEHKAGIGGAQKPNLKNFKGPNGEVAAMDANKPESIPQGWTIDTAGKETADTRARQDFDDFKKTNPEYKKTFEQWKGEQTAAAHAANNRDDKFIAIEQKRASGQPLTPDDKAYDAAYSLWIKKTKVDPGVARAAAFSSMRYVPVVGMDPNDPGKVTLMRAGQAAAAGAGTPQSIAFKSDQAMTNYMTSGKGGQNLATFHTSIDHLQLLQKASAALKNGDIQLFNKWANAYKTATGDPAPTNFNAVKAAVAGEISKTFSSATIPEQEAISATINNAEGDQQIAGAVDYYTNLMQGKVDALQRQYDEGSQGKPAFDKPAGAKTQQLQATRAAQTGKAQRKVGEVKKFPNGKTGVWDGTGWVAQ